MAGRRFQFSSALAPTRFVPTGVSLCSSTLGSPGSGCGRPEARINLGPGTDCEIISRSNRPGSTGFRSLPNDARRERSRASHGDLCIYICIYILYIYRSVNYSGSSWLQRDLPLGTLTIGVDLYISGYLRIRKTTYCCGKQIATVDLV